MKIEELVNPYLLTMAPYSSARDDFKGVAEVYLDANEAWDPGLLGANRYPDPEAKEVRRLLESVLSLPYSMTAIGNGSDEVIDLLIRMFCEVGKDSILIERPTYGAYKVFASTSNIRTIELILNDDLTLPVEKIIETIRTERPKLVFICSPNNPTGRLYALSEIKRIAEANSAITVVDEAYIDFAENAESAVSLIEENERVVVLRTLSKAWGIAGARVGILVATPFIRDLFFKIKPPYNVSSLAQRAAISALGDSKRIRENIKRTNSEKARLESFYKTLPFVKEVIASSGNFSLVRTEDADSLYSYLTERGIIVRNRTHEPLLSGCLRITVGSESENERLMEALLGYKR